MHRKVIKVDGSIYDGVGRSSKIDGRFHAPDFLHHDLMIVVHANFICFYKKMDNGY